MVGTVTVSKTVACMADDRLSVKVILALAQDTLARRHIITMVCTWITPDLTSTHIASDKNNIKN